MFCSNLHMLLALARETPQVLAQLGISMAMLQKEQEDLQNVEKLKVGWFTEETQGGGKRMVGQGHHPATSCLSFLALSLVIRRALFVRGLYCKAHERFWFLLAIFQLTCETCTMPPAEMHAITGYHGSIYCATYVHALKLWFMAQRHRVHTAWVPIRRYWPLRMSSTVLVSHHV